MEKYNTIGIGYNTTRQADPYLLDRLCAHLGPVGAGQILDIGCGTGNYTIALHKKGYQLIGVEPSTVMLEIAKSKSSTIQWRLGHVEAIPLESNAVKGAMATLTIHHWSSLEKGFNELFRVLKPGSKLALFTATPQQMEGYWLNQYFPEMLQQSIVQMPSYKDVLHALNSSGFENIITEQYSIQDDLQDQFLYVGKNKPELYLDATVRKGISSFSNLANQEEVNKGLFQLNEAIKSGAIKEVMKRYENDLGDYLFITAEKRMH